MDVDGRELTVERGETAYRKQIGSADVRRLIRLSEVTSDWRQKSRDDRSCPKRGC